MQAGCASIRIGLRVRRRETSRHRDRYGDGCEPFRGVARVARLHRVVRVVGKALAEVAAAEAREDWRAAREHYESTVFIIDVSLLDVKAALTRARIDVPALYRRARLRTVDR